MGNSRSPGCRLWCLLWRLLCCPFSDRMSWMGSGTLFSQFLRDFLPTLSFLRNKDVAECIFSPDCALTRGKATDEAGMPSDVSF